MIKFKFLIFLSVFTFSGLLAQNPCRESLYESNKLYEAGNIRQCITMLEPCAEKLAKKAIKNKEELIESYHLLALAYLSEKNTDMARKYIIMMLKLKPDYHRFPNIDPLDFSRLVKEYSVSPGLFIGLAAGFNINSVSLKKSYAVYASEQYYNPVPGYQIGINADYRFKKQIGIFAEFQNCGIGVRHIFEDAGGYKQEYREQQSYSQLNLGARYLFRTDKKIMFNAGLGMGLGYLNRSNVYFRSTNLETGTFTESTQDPISMRNKMQFFTLGTCGVYTNLPRGLFGIEATFAWFFTQSVNPSKRMQDLDFVFNNQYVNDDIVFRPVFFNITYKLPLRWRVDLVKKE